MRLAVVAVVVLMVCKRTVILADLVTSMAVQVRHFQPVQQQQVVHLIRVVVEVVEHIFHQELTEQALLVDQVLLLLHIQQHTMR
jgi:hypothetical protein